jgi:hypothetical protein
MPQTSSSRPKCAETPCAHQKQQEKYRQQGRKRKYHDHITIGVYLGSSVLDTCGNNVIKSMARMTQQRVTELRGDSNICSIGTTLKAQANNEVPSPLGVDKLDAERLVLAFAGKCPSIMHRLCKLISLSLSNLLV